MKEPFVSVIVPVYNVENYLYNCLESLRNQTFKDFEVLLVDDGSTDESNNICFDYCAKYPYFHLLNKENGGVASARQLGLSSSIGEYVIHVDPDDYVESRFLEKLYNKAKENNADMVVCDYIEEFPKYSKDFQHNSLNISKAEDLFDAVISGKVWGVLWNKLIRRNIIGSIKFEDGINIQEDKLFICRVLRRAKNIAYVEIPLYHYNRQNENSILGKSYRTKQQVIQKWKVIDIIVAEEYNPLKKTYLLEQMVDISRLLELWRRNDISQKEYSKIIYNLRDGLRNIIKIDTSVSLSTKLILYLSTIIEGNWFKSLISQALVNRR